MAWSRRALSPRQGWWSGGVDGACRMIRGFGIRRVIVAVTKEAVV